MTTLTLVDFRAHADLRIIRTTLATHLKRTVTTAGSTDQACAWDMHLHTTADASDVRAAAEMYLDPARIEYRISTTGDAS